VIYADSGCALISAWSSRALSHVDIRLSGVAFRPGILRFRATVTPRLSGSVTLSRWSHRSSIALERMSCRRRHLPLPAGSCEQRRKHRYPALLPRMCQFFSHYFATNLSQREHQRLYRDTGGATDQRTHLSTALGPCAPYSRSQLSLMRFMGSPRSHAVKRTSDNIRSHILIWVEGGQSGVTCQVHNSPSFTGTMR
jgi:hypothetical protein